MHKLVCILKESSNYKDFLNLKAFPFGINHRLVKKMVFYIKSGILVALLEAL